MKLPDDGLVLVVKEDCPTCRLVVPAATELRRRGLLAAVFSQDNPAFPAGLEVGDDRELEVSFRLRTAIVPTLVRRRDGREDGRAVGWHKGEWRALTGVADLGEELPDERPGCSSRSSEPGAQEELVARYGRTGLRSSPVAVDFPVDASELMFERGWTDGLPAMAPTPARTLRMLAGTTRRPDEVLGAIPPSGAACTVEKAAVNAVMAGCAPESFPVVLAALEAALEPDFAWQGLLSTTMGAGVCVVVNGPVAGRAGVNSGFNALGHGTRANATVARALLLTAINIGGARPGGVDRSTLGHPGKHGLCFAEDESDDAWQPLAQARGIAPGRSAVTVFGFCGNCVVSDETAREPVGLTENIAAALNAVIRPARGGGTGAMAVLGGEFWRIYRDAGWNRERVDRALGETTSRLRRQAESAGAGDEHDPAMPAFAPGDLLVARAGSNAGLFATILQGWGSGPKGSQPVTREVVP